MHGQVSLSIESFLYITFLRLFYRMGKMIWLNLNTRVQINETEWMA